MPRIRPIRISQNDKTEYARLVRNTKAKVRRTIKNYGIDLSNEIDLPSLDSFKTRNEFNEWKQRTSSFTNRNNLHYQFRKNQYDVVASKAELNQVERDTKRAQRLADQLREEKKDLPFYSGGQAQDMRVGEREASRQRSELGISKPRDFVFQNVRSRRDLERMSDNMQNKATPQYYDKKMEQMKENFITILELSFNSNADDLIEALKEIPPDDFYEMYLMFDEFDFSLYDSEGGVEDNGKVDQMLQYIERYYQSGINFDLKGF